MRINGRARAGGRGPGGRAVAVGMGLAVALAMTTPAAGAAIPHPAVVSMDPANYTPALVKTEDWKPIVDAIAVSGDVVFAGGRFAKVEQGGQAYNRSHLVVFNRVTGAVSPVALNPNNRVWALETIGDWIYVGGQFTAIGGTSKRSIVRVNAVTGDIDPGFTSAVRGRVNALVAGNGVLYAGGAFADKLVALDPVTGADTGRFDLEISDQLPGSWGKVTVQALALDPQGDKLIATGNFRRVVGQLRSRLFVADVSGQNAALDPWYYQPFSEDCSSEHPRRIAYLHGVDFSPDGSHFAVGATGQIPEPGDLFKTVCDAVGYFSMANDNSHVWLNYTGGDSVWAVAHTGTAVYAQGHFQWLDNPYGWASKDGGGAASRLGIGAIDPQSGLALPWDPPKRAAIGGRAFLATPTGLWVGSDSMHFNGENRWGLAFCPLP